LIKFLFLQKDKPMRDEDDEEIEEIFKNAGTGKVSSSAAAVEQKEKTSNVALDLTTPKKKTRGSTRLTSKTPDTSAQVKRAISVPISTTSGTSSTRTHSRSSRASSELRHNPKAILKEKILERIEESPVPEGPITRKKSQMLLQQSRETTPVTPNRSRAPSEDLDSPKRSSRRRSTATPSGTPTRLTPVGTPTRMSTRAFSRESLASDKTTPEDSRPSSRRGQKKVSEPTVDEMPAPSSESLSQSIGDYNRRLTRAQQAMLEKQSSSQSVTVTTEDQRKFFQHRVMKTADIGYSSSEESDEEEIVSVTSETSSRASRKRKSDNADKSSTASKSSRKSNSPVKKHQLSMIPEENTEGEK
jgi:trimeric autotransporter adhesin